MSQGNQSSSLQSSQLLSSKLESSKLQWKTEVILESFSAVTLDRSIDLQIECLESLEQTIDDLFDELTRTGNPNLLEDLCPYFGVLWPSARALSEFILTGTLEREGAVEVLEVGCGLAIPSLIFAQIKNLSKITASDFHPEVPKFLERNLKHNHVSDLEYIEMDWRSPAASIPKYDVVMGSDVLYEKTHPSDLAEALSRLAKGKGRIIIADPARPYLQNFVDEMNARGWFADQTIMSVKGNDSKPQDIFILDFVRDLGVQHKAVKKLVI